MAEELMPYLTAVAYAIAAAILYSLIGYFKRSDSMEAFEGEQFFCSLAVGVIAGLFSMWFEMTPQAALTMIMADAGLVYTIENIAKAIWRRWISPWLQKQKVAPAAPTAPTP